LKKEGKKKEKELKRLLRCNKEKNDEKKKEKGPALHTEETPDGSYEQKATEPEAEESIRFKDGNESQQKVEKLLMETKEMELSILKIRDENKRLGEIFEEKKQETIDLKSKSFVNEPFFRSKSSMKPPRRTSTSNIEYSQSNVERKLFSNKKFKKQEDQRELLAETMVSLRIPDETKELIGSFLKSLFAYKESAETLMKAQGLKTIQQILGNLKEKSFAVLSEYKDISIQNEASLSEDSGERERASILIEHLSRRKEELDSGIEKEYERLLEAYEELENLKARMEHEKEKQVKLKRLVDTQMSMLKDAENSMSDDKDMGNDEEEYSEMNVTRKISFENEEIKDECSKDLAKNEFAFKLKGHYQRAQGKTIFSNKKFIFERSRNFEQLQCGTKKVQRNTRKTDFHCKKLWDFLNRNSIGLL
jgi:hypothetical protein